MFPVVYWGPLLRQLRDSYKISQKQLAPVLHCTPQNISSVETGRTQPSAEEIAALSYIYRINLLEYVYRCLPAEYLEEQQRFRKEYILSPSKGSKTGSDVKTEASSSAPESGIPDNSRILYQPDTAMDPLRHLQSGPVHLVADVHPYYGKSPRKPDTKSDPKSDPKSDRKSDPKTES